MSASDHDDELAEECGGEMETMMQWAEGQVPPGYLLYKMMG
jgi:hypothetical protein